MCTKNIIYSVAVGTYYCKLAQMMVNSIRLTGWDKDIIVFADNDIKNAITIPFKGNALEAKYKRVDLWIDSPLDCDKALYCDADILWYKNPSVLFNFALDNYSFYSFAEGTILERLNVNAHDWFSHYLTPDEIKSHHLAFNSGLLCANKETWIDANNYWKRLDNHFSDQAALNREYVRGNIKITAFPKQWLNFVDPTIHQNQNCLVEHWTAGNKIVEMTKKYEDLSGR